MRDAINAGVMVGPRLHVCGRPIITGSHLDLTLPRAAERKPGFTADGPWALRALAREHLRAGADLLKTSVSGGGGTQDEEPDVRNMTQEELEAIVDEGHAFHKPTSAHCFTAESHKMCVRAKVDTIEHMVFHDKESVAMIKDSGIPVTPTLSHRTDHAIEVRSRIGTPRNVLDKMKKIQPYTFETFKVMHQAGIKIAMGTDLGPEPEIGTNAKELELYVELGMTPMEAIQTATKNAAEAMWLGKDLGTIEAGKLADILAIDGDPSRDISVLSSKDNIRMVMKEGEAWVDKISPQHRRWSSVNPDPGRSSITHKWPASSSCLTSRGGSASLRAVPRGSVCRWPPGWPRRGSNLVICSRKLERCEQAAATLRGLGVEVLAVECDVSKADQVERLKDETLSRFGRVDVLVNNAGRTWWAPPEETPLDKWQ